MTTSKVSGKVDSENGPGDLRGGPMEWHPFAEKFPLLEGAEWEAFKASIKATGRNEQPITYRMVRGRKQGLDGRNRYRACQELGIKPRMEKVFLSDGQVKDYIIRRNVHRRHLTPELRREIVGELRQEGKSTREIADIVGVSNATVARDLDGTHKQSPVTNVTPDLNPSVSDPPRIAGRDGKSYAAEQPARQPSAAKAGPLFAPSKPAVPPFDLADFAVRYRVLAESIEHFGRFYGCEVLATANLLSLDGWRQDFLASWKNVTGAELPPEYG
jgi:hypothetical protein